MKELRNCPLCSSLFSYSGMDSLCPKCSTEAEVEFAKIREYIFNNPGSSSFEVASATGVKQELILRFVRDGRLSHK